jgi:hypothetical protein
MTNAGKSSKCLHHYLTTVCVPLAAIVFVLMLAARAAAFTLILAPFTGATDFITGFPPCVFPTTAPLSIGPVGVLFDGAHFFADDACNAVTYRLIATGGNVSSPDAQRRNGLTHGLTLKGGVYYGASSIPHIPNGFPGQGIYKFDPTTLHNLGVVTINFPQFASSPPFLANVPNAILQVVGDPLSSDLYVSTFSGIYRVQNPNSGSPTVTQVNSRLVDGMAFTDDGTILYAAEFFPVRNVVGFDRTFSLPVFSVNIGRSADGIAVALNNTTLGGVNVSNNVFANNNDGTIVRIDVNNGNAVSVVASGGTRGDFATVGPDNCLYVTQSDRIEKMSPCFFQVSIANKCPLGSGNWKNNPAWPVTSLTLGSQSYTQAELTVILKTPAGGDASLILADALIATELSIAGDSNPGPIASTVSDADSLLATQSGLLPYSIKPSSGTGQAMVNDADILTSYNSGALTLSCTP